MTDTTTLPFWLAEKDETEFCAVTGKHTRKWRHIGYFQGDRDTVEQFLREAEVYSPTLTEVKFTAIGAEALSQLKRAKLQLREAETFLKLAKGAIR